MTKEVQTIHPGDKPTNGSAKFALEKGGLREEIDVFLEGARVDNPIKITHSFVNGHDVLATWTGRKISAIDLGIKSVSEAKGTGCLVITEGSKQTTIFMEAGEIKREEVTINGIMQKDLERQGRFEL